MLKELQHIPTEKETLNIPMDMFDLSVRASNALAKAGIKTISDFIFFGSEKLSRISNTGEKTIYEIENAIKEILTTGKYGNREEISSEHNNEEYIKAENPNLTFEEQIRKSFDGKLINTPIEELNLTFRAINGLKKAGLKTINDVVNFGLRDLQANKNIGKKTIADIKASILAIPKIQPDVMSEIPFVDAIDSILTSVTPKYLPIIKMRLGYDGKHQTLDAIGKNIGITRERVRQITEKEIRRIKHPKIKNSLQSIIENIERLLLQYNGIISVIDLIKDTYFIAGTQNRVSFLMDLIVELYGERYRIIDNYFLTSLSDYEIKALQAKIREAALECRFPIDENTFIESIISSVGSISKYYLSNHLLYKERIEASKGKILSLGRLSIPQRVKLIMRDIDRPMHFTEIAKLYRDHFVGKTSKTVTREHTIHARIGDSKDFIIVGPGTFMLRDKFRVPDNIKEIVKISGEILQSLQSISDTKYLIKVFKRRNVDIGNLNEYSLKTILLEHPCFVSYVKFEIGLEELVKKYERKPLGNLIFEILYSSKKPMHGKTIWKEISKQRGFPEYAISQQLADDPRFIRVAVATYTVANNISQYSEKCRIIIEFAKEWINLKQNPVSAFLVNEVLKETEKIRDLSLGLVEHVLSTSPEFVKLPNGFYDLSKG